MENNTAKTDEIVESNIGGFIISHFLNFILYGIVFGIIVNIYFGNIISILMVQASLNIGIHSILTGVIVISINLLLIILTNVFTVRLATKDAIRKNKILPKDEQKTLNILVKTFAIVISVFTVLEICSAKFIYDSNSKLVRNNYSDILNSPEMFLIGIFVIIFINIIIFAILTASQRHYLHKQIKVMK